MLVAHRCSAGRDGTVDAGYGELGIEHVVTLEVGDIFFAEVGCEHAPIRSVERASGGRARGSV